MEAIAEVRADRTRTRRLFTRPLDVLVLMGGPSTERAVSLVSGAAVADALAAAGHRVRRADIRPEDTTALDGLRPDVVFIAMHGAFGEDGQVQALCERRGLPYVGSSAQACALAMDKSASKYAYCGAGLHTAEWTVIEAAHDAATRRRLLDSIGTPCVLKPVDGGSSVDVHILREGGIPAEAVDDLLVKYGRFMIERFVAGRELTVGVLGDRALPVIEIRPKSAFYDYHAKYEADTTEYLFEHGLPDEAAARLQAAALAAHRALGCRDLSRTDFLLDAAGVPWVLETNAIPGFTSHSLLPKAAARVGIDFARLCEELLHMALQRAGSARLAAS